MVQRSAFCLFRLSWFHVLKVILLVETRGMHRLFVNLVIVLIAAMDEAGTSTYLNFKAFTI